MFRVERDGEGYVLLTDTFEESFSNASKLNMRIRELLGMPHQGRPKGSKNAPKENKLALNDPPF
jgi:hypothetical protein